MKAKQIVKLSSGDVIDFSTVVLISKPSFCIQTRDSGGNMAHIVEDPTGEIREEAVKAFEENNRLERKLELIKLMAEIESLEKTTS